MLSIWMVRHQRRLKRQAWLMQEAMRNRDFTFRLSTKGLLPGERAMQDALNQLGHTIKLQVNRSEVESWERLTRVLTHEIMNATAPISSITQSMLSRDDVKGTPLEEGIKAIHDTSKNLNTFVESYRRFSQLQKVEATEVELGTAISDIVHLYPTLSWSVNGVEEMLVRTDPTMLRQVLINLTKNAMEAGATSMGIEMAETEEKGHTALYISNNGQPIPAEARQSVFVPFFTTKRSGSGIGLSLSRRMMTLQGGGLELLERPRPGYHVSFLITL